MSKINISRTFGPIHFEDLDPHRFEDLIRELVYDYKDWQSIEATGRSGSDDGFDIRGFEKVSGYYNDGNAEEIDDQETNIHPMDGNLWMIQCKRESEIGPQKVVKIISDGVNSETPPYGYILVASANFSKKSYDNFRDELRKRGVMEFYLWGKAELEDMLHMPKYDRILFTFFGISLVTKKRSRGTEVRSFVATKNKLFRILGEDDNSFKDVFVRDINDTSYPYKEDYKDFDLKPRWKKYRFKIYSVFGIWVQLYEYYAYLDKHKKQWDYVDSFDLNTIYEEGESEEERVKKMEQNILVRDFWEGLPKVKQSEVAIWGLIKFDDILVIDEKGDKINKFLHLYVDYNRPNGPFERMLYVMGRGHEQIAIEKEDYKRIKVFPDKIPPLTVGKFHEANLILLDKETFSRLLKGDRDLKAVYDDDGRYDFLSQSDTIKIASKETGNAEIFIKVTCKYKMKLEDYLNENDDNYYLKELVEKQLAKELNKEDMINIYEFVRSYNV